MAKLDLEPCFFAGGPTSCLLVHGFSGSPPEIRPMGEYLTAQGLTVLGVRLAGHGTFPEDMAKTTWHDWVASAEEDLRELQLGRRAVVAAKALQLLLQRGDQAAGTHRRRASVLDVGTHVGVRLLGDRRQAGQRVGRLGVLTADELFSDGLCLQVQIAQHLAQAVVQFAGQPLALLQRRQRPLLGEQTGFGLPALARIVQDQHLAQQPPLPVHQRR